MVETATADMSARAWMAACVRDGDLAWPSEVEGHAAAIRWAERNGVLGVMSGLANSSSVPTAMREALASHQRQCVARQMARNRVLAELSTSTKAQGVRALLIKGTAVGPGCYPHSWMRQGCDIDIWVPPGDVRTVQQLSISPPCLIHECG